MIGTCKSLLSYAVMGVVLAAPVAVAKADYPERPIVVTVGYGAGGSTDTLVRALSAAAAENIGQPIVIENRPGASSSIQTAHLVRSNPDGYTLGSVLVGAIINQYMRETAYDVANDVTPVMMFAKLPYGLVVPNDSQWDSLDALVQYGRDNPNTLRYSTAGVGSSQHLTMELLGKQEGIEWIHVPYKSGPEALLAAVQGEVDFAAQSAEWGPFVREGRLRALATFDSTRYSEFPEVPTLLELGYDIVAPSMIGIAGPLGMDGEIVEKLHQAYKSAMTDQRFINAVKQTGWEIEYRGPAEFAEYIKSMDEHYSSVIDVAGLGENE